MSSTLTSAQAEWLRQLEAMRQAIAELKLPAESVQSRAYGDDLDLDDDDLSGTAGSEDIWDILSKTSEDDYSSDHLDDDGTGIKVYDQQWLAQQCTYVAQRGSGLDANTLREHILAVLASDSNGESGSDRVSGTD